MTSSKTEGPLGKDKILLSQYQAFIDVYKQHFDLFLKGVVLYLAVISVIAGLVFGKDTEMASRVLLSALIPTGSAVAVLGCVVSRRWVLDLEFVLRRIEKELGVESFPFSGAKGIVGTMIVVATIFSVCGLVVVWAIWRPCA